MIDAATEETRGSRVGGIVISAVVAVGAVTVLCALRWLDWASRDDGTSRSILAGGPTGVLAGAAIASCVCAVLVASVPRRWPSVLLLASALLTAVTAVAVALSRIAAANSIAGLGATRTSYEPGAAVGVVAALVTLGVSVVGVSRSCRCPEEGASAPSRGA